MTKNGNHHRKVYVFSIDARVTIYRTNEKRDMRYNKTHVLWCSF